MEEETYKLLLTGLGELLDSVPPFSPGTLGGGIFGQCSLLSQPREFSDTDFHTGGFGKFIERVKMKPSMKKAGISPVVLYKKIKSEAQLTFSGGRGTVGVHVWAKFVYPAAFFLSLP